MRAVRDEIVLKDLPCPFRHLEYGAVKSAIAINILDGQAVIFLMEKKAHYAAAAEGHCAFAQHHRNAAHLSVLLADRDILNGTQAHLFGRFSLALKLNGVVLNRQLSAGIALHAFKSENMCRMYGRIGNECLRGVLFLSFGTHRKPSQENKQSQAKSQQGSVRARIELSIHNCFLQLWKVQSRCQNRATPCLISFRWIQRTTRQRWAQERQSLCPPAVNVTCGGPGRQSNVEPT